jgi:hypothetical protein
MDNISFHFEESVQRCRRVNQKRIAQEKELSKKAFECKGVMELLEVVGMMRTVTNLGDYYKRLVKEFIVNISEDCSEGDEEARKVYVRGRCINSHQLQSISIWRGMNKTKLKNLI